MVEDEMMVLDESLKIKKIFQDGMERFVMSLDNKYKDKRNLLIE